MRCSTTHTTNYPAPNVKNRSAGDRCNGEVASYASHQADHEPVLVLRRECYAVERRSREEVV